MQIAVGVKKCLVASAKTSIDKSMSVRFGIIFITTKNIGPLNSNLAALVGTEMITVFVDDADLQAGAHAHGAGFAVPRRKWIRGHLVSRFRHPVGFDERNFEEIFDFVD